MTCAISSVFAAPAARPATRDPRIEACLEQIRVAYLWHSGHYAKDRLAAMSGCAPRTVEHWCWLAVRYRLPESEGLRRHLGLDLDDSELIDVPA